MNKTTAAMVIFCFAAVLLAARGTTASVEKLSFEQLDWVEPNSTTEDTAWGRVRLDFNGYSGIRYFNLNVDDQWVVRNMSISSAYGPNVPQTVMTFFDLGVEDGCDVTSVDYVHSINSVPVLSMPNGTPTSADVYDVSYRIGREIGVNLVLPPPPPPPPPNQAPVIYSGQLANIGKFITRETGFNECVPAAIASSLKYLESTGKIDFSEDISDIKPWVSWTGWGTPRNWSYVKRDYLEEKDISVRFIDVNTVLTQSIVLELIDELNLGQDIEVDTNGHTEVLAGIRMRSDGTIEMDLFDDSNQADGKIDPMHTSLYDDVNNSIDCGLVLQRFVVECPDYWTVPNQGGWREEVKLTASDGNAPDRFGWSVAIDGDYAVVGTYSADANGVNSGAAYIFEHNNANWTETKLVGSDTGAYDEFGYSVSVSGSYAIIGAIRNDDKGNNTDKGSAYIFEANDVNSRIWDEKAKLTASDANNRMWFGYSVSISGDRAVVGAFNAGEPNNSGVAYVFERSSNPSDPNWYEKDILTASDGHAGDYFGYSVAVDGDYVAVGAMYGNGNTADSGAAYIFTPNDVDPNIWDEQAKLTASDGNELDEFGHSVSISDGYVAVGAPGDEPNGYFSGSVYVFEWQGGTNWVEQAKLIASDGDDRDAFGDSVSIKDKRIIAGAWGDDHNGITNSGSAYVFDGAYGPGGLTWTEKSKLVSSDFDYRDFFGSSVGVDRCYAIVGAYSDHPSQLNPGAAYVFKTMPEDPSGDCAVDWEDLKILADQWLESN